MNQLVTIAATAVAVPGFFLISVRLLAIGMTARIPAPARKPGASSAVEQATRDIS